MKKFIISLVFFILCFGMFNQTIALDTINYKKQEILYKTKLNKTLKGQQLLNAADALIAKCVDNEAMLSKLQTNILKINKNSLKNENTLNFLNYLEAIINQQIVTTTTAKTLTAETTTTPNGIDTSTLGEITITYNGASYTIADKNLGAMAIFTGSENSDVRGNYYQWGNNYGFANNLSGDGGGQVDASGYGPGTVNGYYNNSTFRSWPSDWSSVHNDNLWGNTINTFEARQGPCDDGRHVPTSLEWDGLFKAWCQYRGGTSEQCTIPAGSAKSWSTLSGYNTALTLENFKNDLKLPLAGLRDRLNGSLNNQGSSGHYWSSSPNDIDDVYRLDLHSSEVRPQSDSNRTFGFSVRCFKNGGWEPIATYTSVPGEITIAYNGTSYTIADKNLGATAVFTGSENSNVRGNHYQWGRDIGFSSTSSSAPNTSQSAIDPSTRNTNTNFIWGISLISNKLGRYDGYDWSTTQEDHLWGDTTTSSGSIEGTIQGPCADGWHIPTSVEWDGLVKTWFAYRGVVSCTVNNLGTPCSWSGEATFTNFQNDLKLPLAGVRGRLSGSLSRSITSQDSYGYYWSSSPYWTNALNLRFNSSNIRSKDINYRADGFSVRCFKN